VSLSFLLVVSGFELSWIHIGRQKLALMSLFGMIGRVVSLGFVVVLVQGEGDTLEFAIGILLANAVVCIGTIIYGLKTVSIQWPTASDVKETFFKSLPYAAVTVLVVAIDRFDVVVSKFFFDSQDVGYYAGVARLALGLNMLFAIIVGAFFSEMVVVKDSKSFSKHVEMGLATVLLVLVPLTIGTWFLDKDILTTVYTADFALISNAFSFHILGLAGSVIAGAMALQVLVLKKKTSIVVAYYLVGICLIFILFVFVFDRSSIEKLALSVAIGKIVVAILMMRASRPFIKRWPVDLFMKILAASIVMGFVLFLIPLYGLLPKLITGVVVYMIVIAILARQILVRILKEVRVKLLGGR